MQTKQLRYQKRGVNLQLKVMLLNQLKFKVDKMPLIQDKVDILVLMIGLIHQKVKENYQLTQAN